MPKWAIWAIAILAAGVVLWAYMTRERRLTIIAGAVIAPTKTHDLRTSFTIKPYPFFENPFLTFKNSRRSHGHAGACLLADASSLDPRLASPKTDEDCAAGLPTEGGPDDGWASYLLAGRCWIRGRGSKYCVKSGTDNDGEPWPDGTYGVPLNGTINIDDMYAEMKRRGAKGKFMINWKTLACLNPVDPNDPSRDVLSCGGEPGPEPLHREGPVATLP